MAEGGVSESRGTSPTTGTDDPGAAEVRHTTAPLGLRTAQQSRRDRRQKKRTWEPGTLSQGHRGQQERCQLEDQKGQRQRREERNRWGNSGLARAGWMENYMKDIPSTQEIDEKIEPTMNRKNRGT